MILQFLINRLHLDTPLYSAGKNDPLASISCQTIHQKVKNNQ